MRCAVRKGLIETWDSFEECYGADLVESGDCYVPVFCDRHDEQGKKLFKEGGRANLVSKNMTEEFKAKLAEARQIKKQQKQQTKPSSEKNPKKVAK